MINTPFGVGSPNCRARSVNEFLRFRIHAFSRSSPPDAVHLGGLDHFEQPGQGQHVATPTGGPDNVFKDCLLLANLLAGYQWPMAFMLRLFLGLSLTIGSLRSAELYTFRAASGRVWSASDISESGEVVGGFSNGFLYDGDDSPEVPELVGTNYSRLNGINSNGLVVGERVVWLNNASTRRAFVLNLRSRALNDLGTLAGTSGDSAATAVNDAGIIVGTSETQGKTHAVRFEMDGRITDLGTLGGSNSYAADVNANGEIVGTALNGNQQARAFVFRETSMIDLGTLGGSASWAARINNRGTIVGTSENAAGERHAFLYSNGTMTDLGTLGGTESVGYGINDYGVVVGMSTLANRDQTGFIKFPGEPMRDLWSMTIVTTGQFMISANAINNRGMIAVTVFQRTYRTGVQHIGVLTPGKLSSSWTNDHWEVSVAVPRGYEAVVEASDDLNVWTPRLTTVSDESMVTHREPIGEGKRFFRTYFRWIAE